jgi:membrane-associated phospholipid phosphatase
MLPGLFEKLKKYRKWFWIGPSVYTALVMISRIIMGAHFLSDTLIALAISLGSIMIIYGIFNQIGKRRKNEISYS